MKRKGSEKVRYGVSEGSWWYSLQPDEAEIWDLLNHRGSGTEGAERKKHKWESERRNVHLRRGAKYASLRQAKMQESIQMCTYTVCILSVCIFSGANKICRVSAVWGERVMCLGRELSGESGEGVSEAAVWTDIGCRLSFALSHKRTQQQRHQPHSWTERTSLSEGVTLFGTLSLFPSLASLIILRNQKSRALFSYQTFRFFFSTFQLKYTGQDLFFYQNHPCLTVGNVPLPPANLQFHKVVVGCICTC